MKEFDSRTIAEIGSYVYCLIDPKTNMPFYIGKGTGNRVFSHAQAAIVSTDSNEKLDFIKKIIEDGKKVQHLIIRHGLDAKDSFLLESALIDFATRFGVNLKNVASGHHSHKSGIMTASELNRKFCAEPLDNIEEGCIIININSSYKRAQGIEVIYNATKQSWVISSKKVQNIKFVLSEYKGFIVEVFQVEKDGWCTVEDHNKKIRWGFNGKVAPDEIRNRYINRKIQKKPGSANPITYSI